METKAILYVSPVSARPTSDPFINAVGGWVVLRERDAADEVLAGLVFQLEILAER
jgi:hypothetical protein